jgi:hypothetical protein
MHTVVPFSDAFRPNLVDTEDLPKVALAATGRAVNWAMADMMGRVSTFHSKVLQEAYRQTAALVLVRHAAR